MFSNELSDRDIFLSRSRGKQGAIDPIEQQRSALFGDDVKPFLGTMEELSRTKRRQAQRARELLFGSEPELSSQSELMETGGEENNVNRVWFGFDNWKGFEDSVEEKTVEPSPSESVNHDDEDFVAACFDFEPPSVSEDAQSSGPAVDSQKQVSPLGSADETITAEDIADFLRERPEAQQSGLKDEPVKARKDSARRFEPEPIETEETEPAVKTSVLSHRWTLEELWSFVLQLNKLETELEVGPEPSRPSGQTRNKEHGAPANNAALMPDGALYYTEPRPAATNYAPPRQFTPPEHQAQAQPDFAFREHVAQPPAREVNEPAHTAAYSGLEASQELPQGRTPEETFASAMAVVESQSINVRQRKSRVFRIIAALIILGAAALITLGILQAVQLSSDPAGMFREPEFMRGRIS